MNTDLNEEEISIEIQEYKQPRKTKKRINKSPREIKKTK